MCTLGDRVGTTDLTAVDTEDGLFATLEISDIVKDKSQRRNPVPDHKIPLWYSYKKNYTCFGATFCHHHLKNMDNFTLI